MAVQVFVQTEKMEEALPMNLLESMMDACVILDKTTRNDGVFGRVEVYVPGASFNATIIKDNSMEARLAEKQGVTEVYTVVTEKGFGLSYHDVFRRESDGQVFRVTSNQKDSEAPEASTVKIGKVTAERWELPA